MIILDDIEIGLYFNMGEGEIFVFCWVMKERKGGILVDGICNYKGNIVVDGRICFWGDDK